MREWDARSLKETCRGTVRIAAGGGPGGGGVASDVLRHRRAFRLHANVPCVGRRCEQAARAPPRPPGSGRAARLASSVRAAKLRAHRRRRRHPCRREGARASRRTQSPPIHFGIHRRYTQTEIHTPRELEGGRGSGQTRPAYSLYVRASYARRWRRHAVLTQRCGGVHAGGGLLLRVAAGPGGTHVERGERGAATVQRLRQLEQAESASQRRHAEPAAIQSSGGEPLAPLDL